MTDVGRRSLIRYTLQELYEHRFRRINIPSCITEQSCLGIALQYLYAITVTASHEQEALRWRQGEVARMHTRQLIADALWQPRLWVNLVDADAISLQTM